MTLTFGEKIKEARKSKKLTQKQLADKIGAAHNSISDWENDKNKPDPDTIEILCGVLELTPNYLLAAASDDIAPSEKLLINLYRNLDDSGKKHIKYELERESARVQQLTELRSQPATVIDFQEHKDQITRLAEYFRSASAGGGVFILGNEATSKIAISEADWDDRVDYVISISGDSMEPDFSDGDKVMVSQRMEIHHGDVGIFVVDGKAFIKEYGEHELISRNHKRPNIKISEYSNIVCMGKVIGKLTGPFQIIDD